MKITRDEVLHVAELARLEVKESDVDRFASQIGTILSYVEKLNQADTTGVKPTSHAIFLTNAFREDEEIAHMDRDMALSNAPEKDEGSFIVPRVVG